MNDSSRIEQKLDTISADINSIKIILGKQHVSLKEHMRRTEILEEELKPLKKHSYMMDGVVKFIGFLGVLAGIYEALSWIKR